MSDIRVKVDPQNTKVRVGQQNAIKVVSSVSGSSDTAVNVIGGTASVTQLNVSGTSTFVGLATFNNDVYIDGDLYVQNDIFFDDLNANDASLSGTFYVSGISTLAADGGITTTGGDLYVGGDLYIEDDLVFDEFTARNGNITGILTVADGIYYPIGEPFGIAYFDLNDKLVSAGSTSTSISETNYIVSTNSSGIPTWSNTIDGGSY
jgi:cytoskeletal protein CcmA (bactofilin family)